MKRCSRVRENPDPIVWWLLGGGVVLVGGIVIYAATRPSLSSVASAPGSSASNPVSIPSTQVYGPQGQYATKVVGGMNVLGQFSKPVTVLGATQYEFVTISSTPTAATAVSQEAAATNTANASAESNQAAYAAYMNSTPTTLPSGQFTYSLTLTNPTSDVQVNVGDTVALAFPNQNCGTNWGWQVTAGNSSVVSFNTPNVLIAVEPGQATVTFTCLGTTRTLNVTVVSPTTGTSLGP